MRHHFYLVSPGVTAPDTVGAMLMTVAGISWGVYSLLGRGVADPLAAIANNFIFCVPLVVAVNLVFPGDNHLTFGGVVFLAEEVTPRLLAASFATLGGVWLVLAQRAKSARSPHDVFGDV
ncbi:MAG: hypothetical protein MUO51_00310 [Woeseiaceae bacterium]|nr:hypothetical protein [Woeseiaceae bacterium]